MNKLNGPWTARQVGESGFADHTPVFEITDASGKLIATIAGAELAASIGALPDLVKALQALCDELQLDDIQAGQFDHWSGRAQYQNARAALAKATSPAACDPRSAGLGLRCGK